MNDKSDDNWCFPMAYIGMQKLRSVFKYSTFWKEMIDGILNFQVSKDFHVQN